MTVEAEAAATAEDVRAAQGIAGELTWLACRTRPDVSFATNKLSQLISRSPLAAIRIGYSVLQYLKGTVSLGLVYGPARGDHGPDGVFRVKGAGHLLEMRCDASFGPDSGRSQTGLVAMFGDGAIAWLSLRQSTTALSSAEAELNSCLEGFVLGESVTPLLSELLGVAVQRTMLNDSVSAVALLQYPSGAWRTRHLRLKARAWIQAVEEERWKLYHMPGRHMLGDLLTKQLHQPRLGELLKLLGMLLPEQAVEAPVRAAAVECVGHPLHATPASGSPAGSVAPLVPSPVLAALVFLSMLGGVDGFSLVVDTGDDPVMLPGWMVVVGVVCWTFAALGFFEGLKWFLSAALSWWRRLTRRTPAALPTPLAPEPDPVLAVPQPPAPHARQRASSSSTAAPEPEPESMPSGSTDPAPRRRRRATSSPGHFFAIVPKGGECYHIRDCPNLRGAAGLRILRPCPVCKPLE